MKKRVLNILIFLFISILIISTISAFSFREFWNDFKGKISGEATSTFVGPYKVYEGQEKTLKFSSGNKYNIQITGIKDSDYGELIIGEEYWSDFQKGEISTIDVLTAILQIKIIDVYYDNSNSERSYVKFSVAEKICKKGNVDINGDGKIGPDDKSIIDKNFGNKCSSPSWCDCSDINQDRSVDIGDLGLFSSQYTSCEDGTLPGNCSVNKPKYCNEDFELVDSCFECGCSDENQKCLMDGTCITSTGNLQFSGLATNKKIYKLGEEIKFIDESNLIFGEESIKNYKEFYLNNPLISSEYKTRIEQENQYPYQGFIIEFKNPPIFEKRVELESSNKGIKGALYKIVPGRSSDINEQIKDYSEELKNEHEEFIFDSFGVSKASSIQDNIEFTKLFNGVVLDISEEDAKQLLKNPNVKSVYPNYLVHINLQDSVSLINADKVWNLNDNKGYSIDGKGINVVVIDTGIDYTHPDFGSCTKEQFLSGNCEKIKGGYNFIDKNNDPYDNHGHGTHVAGIIAADGNLKGVSPGVNLYSYKVLDSGGDGTFADVMAAIEMASDPDFDYNFDDHFDIISMSLGSSNGDSNDPMSKVVNNVVDVGVVAVIAAGNDGAYGFGTIGSPGTAKNAITVGASCKPEQFYNKSVGLCVPTYEGDVPGVPDFSSQGPENIFEKPDVVAPGVMICSSAAEVLKKELEENQELAKKHSCFDNEHVAFSGTSMATPHVAGVVALIKQSHPDWTPYQIKSALKNNANPFGYSRLIEGAGQVDALKSVKDNKIYPIVNIKEGISEGNSIEYQELCCEYTY